MRADYDVVIFGDSYSARWAALDAIRHHARVGLVLQSTAADIAFPATIQAIADLIATSQSLSRALPFNNIRGLRQWMHRYRKNDLAGLELTRLSQLGVDVIPAPGHFIETPQKTPVVAVQNRQLRSQRYLLAIDPAPVQTATQPNRYHALESFLEGLEKQDQPVTLRLECRHAWVLTLGQILNTLGYPVILSYRDNLLPFEDPDVSFFVQCKLEAEGIRLLQQSDATGPADDLYFDPQSTSALKSLNLQFANIPFDLSQCEPALQIRSDFCTENSRVYVAANHLNPFSSVEVIQHQSAIVLNNLLFDLQGTWEQYPIAQSIPVGLGLSRRGFTEPQARRRCSNVEVMVRSCESGDQAIFCKLIASHKGDILGMHLLGLPGSQSQALLQQIFAQSPSISQLDQGVMSHSTLQQILNDFAYRWRQIKFPQIRDRRERYFRAKRKRFS